MFELQLTSYPFISVSLETEIVIIVDCRTTSRGHLHLVFDGKI